VRFASPIELRRRGVLGINQRNARYLYTLNPRARLPQVDDKLVTRDILAGAKVSTPELYTAVAASHEIPAAVERMKEVGRFVIKPARGSGGRGILVIDGARTDRRGHTRFQKSSGKLIPEAVMRHHLDNVLSGLYSLRGSRDRVIVEELLVPDPIFDDIRWQGVPDIRVLVHRGYPVMAMLRLPTASSDGKANLHQGAVGVGIDIASGTLTGGVQYNAPVEEHPDTLKSFEGRRLADWTNHLFQAARCFDLTGLGYLGVDLVLEESKGPMILEINARPGLGIQIANDAGLEERLTMADGWPGEAEDPRARVGRACRAFGGAQ